MYDTNERNEDGRSRAGKFFSLIIFAVVGLFIFFALIASITSIKPGYNGVVFNRFNGGIQDKTLGQGWKVLLPWETVMKYPVSTETVYMSKVSHEGRKTDDSLWVNTKDGKSINVDVTYSYHFDAMRLPHIYTKFKGADVDTIEFGFMKNEVLQVVNNITSGYPVMSLIGDSRTKINGEIFMALKALFAENGIILESINLSRVEPDAATVEAIQSVVNAQNALLQSKVELNRAEVTANTAREKARGEADAAYITAEGQARANNKLKESLTTEQIIQQQWIAKWNGQQPTTMLGSGTSMMFNQK